MFNFIDEVTSKISLALLLCDKLFSIWTEQCSCFVFWPSRIQISARRLDILRYFVVFLAFKTNSMIVPKIMPRPLLHPYIFQFTNHSSFDAYNMADCLVLDTARINRSILGSL
jgi:hypothetical protein